MLASFITHFLVHLLHLVKKVLPLSLKWGHLHGVDNVNIHIQMKRSDCIAHLQIQAHKGDDSPKPSIEPHKSIIMYTSQVSKPFPFNAYSLIFYWLVRSSLHFKGIAFKKIKVHAQEDGVLQGGAYLKRGGMSISC